MKETSNWLLVDVFTVDQAAALWCDADPTKLKRQIAGNPSEVVAIKQMLTGAIVSGVLAADSSKNPFASIGDHSRSLLTRQALEEFAKSRQQYPAFLFDTLAPFSESVDATGLTSVASTSTSTPSSPKASKGGRPPEYDWDAFMLEIIRIANTPDGLPETRAELVRIMQTWFMETYGCEPAESSIKQRISIIYRYLEEAKNQSD